VRGTSLQSLVIVSMARELNRLVPSEAPGKQGARRNLVWGRPLAGTFAGRPERLQRLSWGSLQLPGTLRLDFPSFHHDD